MSKEEVIDKLNGINDLINRIVLVSDSTTGSPIGLNGYLLSQINKDLEGIKDFVSREDKNEKNTDSQGE